MSMADRSEMQKPEGYPSDEGMEASTSSSDSSTRNWHFLGTSNDMSLLESGLLQRNMDDMGDNYHIFQENRGKPIDPKLVSLLEYSRELFVQSREVFMKIFPGHLQHEIVKLLKYEIAVSQVKIDPMKVRMMQRSLSIGSPRPLCKGGEESPLQLEYFKVRIVHTAGGDPQGDDQGGQDHK